MFLSLLAIGVLAAAAVGLAWWAATPPASSFDSQGRNRLGLDNEKAAASRKRAAA